MQRPSWPCCWTKLEINRSKWLQRGVLKMICQCPEGKRMLRVSGIHLQDMTHRYESLPPSSDWLVWVFWSWIDNHWSSLKCICLSQFSPFVFLFNQPMGPTVGLVVKVGAFTDAPLAFAIQFWVIKLSKVKVWCGQNLSRFHTKMTFLSSPVVEFLLCFLWSATVYLSFPKLWLCMIHLIFTFLLVDLDHFCQSFSPIALWVPKPKDPAQTRADLCAGGFAEGSWGKSLHLQGGMVSKEGLLEGWL